MLWNTMIRPRWSELAAGKKFDLLVADIYHPKNDPRFRKNTGWPVGQACDFTLSMTDGSRVHVQCFGTEGGMHRLRVHRDRWDPDSGLMHFILHAAFETPVGLMVAGAVLLGSGSK